MVRKLHPEETVDVYLAELQKLSVLFGGIAQAILKMGLMTVEQTAAAQLSLSQMKETDSPTTCYKCDGPNHLA